MRRETMTEALVSLGVPIRELVERETTIAEARVLSRLAAGPMTVTRLSQESGVPHAEVSEIVARYIAEGLMSLSR